MSLPRRRPGPEEYREEFQRKLASCATRPEGALRGHAQGDRGRNSRSRSRVFASSTEADRRRLDRPGLPARSTTGRDVAVKVQYPGVAGAVRADMQNLG
jgi:hypothetical protein